MKITFWIGVVGAICSTTASLPQLWKSYKHHATKDLHVFTLCIRIIGCIAWCSYATLLNEYTLATSSAIAFVIECLLFIAKYKYD
jgi:uncharacterized protein with PQ loop repeat